MRNPRISHLPQPTKRLDDSLDLFRALRVLPAEAGGELFGGGGGVGGWAGGRLRRPPGAQPAFFKNVEAKDQFIGASITKEQMRAKLEALM